MSQTSSGEVGGLGQGKAAAVTEQASAAGGRRSRTRLVVQGVLSLVLVMTQATTAVANTVPGVGDRDRHDLFDAGVLGYSGCCGWSGEGWRPVGSWPR
jgi:hypothetical protein